MTCAGMRPTTGFLLLAFFAGSVLLMPHWVAVLSTTPQEQPVVLPVSVHSMDRASAWPERNGTAFDRTVKNHQEYEAYVDELIDDILQPAALYVDINPSRGPYKDAGLTMGNRRLLRQLKRQLEDIVDRRIDGDIYETGTWRGGTAMFMVAVLTAYESLVWGKILPYRRRHYWFFDSFEGFGRGQGLEVGKAMDDHLSNSIYAAPLERVVRSFASFGLWGDQVHFVKGFFETTLPALGVPLNPIALLRLDGDLFSSTMIVLRSFYQSVAEGGWVVIDDYDWHPKSPGVCRSAVNEFRHAWSISAPLVRRFGRPSWMRTAATDGHTPRAHFTTTSSHQSGKARCSAIHWHAKHYERLRRLHSWEELKCSRPIGYRPSAHTSEHVGSTCEAWIHRGVQHVLSRVLEPSMRALEWSTGSSSRYYLHWVGSLHSVEHDKAWANKVGADMNSSLPADVLSRWHLETVSNSTPYRSGQGIDESRLAFASYVGVDLSHKSYDFISVDGRARSACLRRVWNENRVAPGGLLMLDNSMRPQYASARQLFDDSPDWTSIEFRSLGVAALSEVSSTLWCRLR